MAEIKTYKDLKVWQKSMSLVELTYLLTRTFPEDEKFTLTSQIRRCAISIPSNIAEGWGRETSKFYLHFLRISVASLAELETQLEIAVRLNYCERKNEIFELMTEISKMLQSLINKIKTKITDGNYVINEALVPYN